MTFMKLQCGVYFEVLSLLRQCVSKRRGMQKQILEGGVCGLRISISNEKGSKEFGAFQKGTTCYGCLFSKTVSGFQMCFMAGNRNGFPIWTDCCVSRTCSTLVRLLILISMWCVPITWSLLILFWNNQVDQEIQKAFRPRREVDSHPNRLHCSSQTPGEQGRNRIALFVSFCEKKFTKTARSFLLILSVQKPECFCQPGVVFEHNSLSPEIRLFVAPLTQNASLISYRCSQVSQETRRGNAALIEVFKSH